MELKSGQVFLLPSTGSRLTAFGLPSNLYPHSSFLWPIRPLSFSN